QPSNTTRHPAPPTGDAGARADTGCCGSPTTDPSGSKEPHGSRRCQRQYREGREWACQESPVGSGTDDGDAGSAGGWAPCGSFGRPVPATAKVVNAEGSSPETWGGKTSSMMTRTAAASGTASKTPTIPANCSPARTTKIVTTGSRWTTRPITWGTTI